jgi:3-deoxy-D-manno-octulosonic-acid transferase
LRYLLYSIGYVAAFIVALPYFLLRDHKTGRYRRSFAERWGRMPQQLRKDSRPSVWIHAVSVGETLAARPLVTALRPLVSGRRIVVSNTTVTGRTVAEQSLSAVDARFYVPFDLPGPVGRAMAAARPELLVLMETELWPNLIHGARRRGVRTAIVNGRISDRSHHRYLRAKSLFAPVLQEVDLFLMQTAEHADRIRALGALAERVQVTGNLKFDAAEATPPSPALAAIVGGPARAGRLTWIAGSTVTGEEVQVLAALARLRERLPEVDLVLVPRHPERFPEVPGMVAAAGFHCVRRSETRPGEWRPGDVLLLDTMGELAQAYALADVAFVGGSLVPMGGHNILEPAVAGVPVVVGPFMENFREIATQFHAARALVEVRTGVGLAAAIGDLLADPARRTAQAAAASAIVEQNRGAVERTAQALIGLLAS